MTDPSQMPRWAADILRSTCESAAATLAAHGHFDADAAREFVSGLAAGFEVDADDVACALGLDDLELGDAPVGARPPAEDDPPWLDLTEPPPGYQLAPVLLSQAAEAIGERIKEQARALLDDNRIVPWTPDGPMFPAPRNDAPLGLEDGPAGWTYTRPDESIAEAAKRYVGADEDAAHAAAWADHQLAAPPPCVRIVRCGKGFIGLDVTGVMGVEFTAAPDSTAEIAEALRAELEEKGDEISLSMARDIRPARLTEAEAIAAAWADWHAHNCATTLDMLLLAAVWPMPIADGQPWPADIPEEVMEARREWIRGWSLRDRGRAGEWAIAVHVGASDNPRVKIPARPACLDVGRPA